MRCESRLLLQLIISDFFRFCEFLNFILSGKDQQETQTNEV